MNKLSDNKVIILGIDPGTHITGYGLISTNGLHHDVIDYGCIRPPANLKLSDRYLIIFNAIEELLTRYLPEVLAVETQFMHKNVQSTIKLGMARGIALIACKRRGMGIFEYAPTKAKLAVVGNGKASKSQVQGMIKVLLRLAKEPPEDAADALAIAICHAQSLRYRTLCTTEI